MNKAHAAVAFALIGGLAGGLFLGTGSQALEAQVGDNDEDTSKQVRVVDSGMADSVDERVAGVVREATQGAAIVVGEAPAPGNLQGLLVRSRFQDGVVRPAYFDPETASLFIAGRLVGSDGGDYTRTARRSLVSGRVIPEDPQATFQWPSEPQTRNRRQTPRQQPQAPRQAPDAAAGDSADSGMTRSQKRAYLQALKERRAKLEAAKKRRGDTATSGQQDREAERRFVESETDQTAERDIVEPNKSADNAPAPEPEKTASADQADEGMTFERTNPRDKGDASQQELQEMLALTGDETDSITLTEAGNGGNTLYVYADPRCPYCEKLRKALLKNEGYMRENGVGVEWVPVGILGEQSVRDAIRVVDQGVEAVRDGVGAGALPEGDALEAAKKAVVANVEAMQKISVGNRMSTPTMIWSDGDKVQRLFSLPSQDQLTAILQSLEADSGNG